LGDLGIDGTVMLKRIIQKSRAIQQCQGRQSTFCFHKTGELAIPAERVSVLEKGASRHRVRYGNCQIQYRLISTGILRPVLNAPWLWISQAEANFVKQCCEVNSRTLKHVKSSQVCLNYQSSKA
jgi:hypothetical protein